jgi:hypothetical protein
MVYSPKSLYMDIRHDGAVFEAKVSDCRPVEPEPAKQPTPGQKLAERTMKAIWAANDAVNGTPVIKESLATEPNPPEILDGSSEPMREAFEADLIEQMGWNQSYFGRNENQYFDSQIEMIWQAYQAGAKYQPSPLAPSPCMDGVDVGDAVRFIWPGHKWHRTEGTIVSTMGDPSIFVDIKEYPYRFRSDCGAFERWCSVDQLERIDQADPINPSHYKQGGIECIEAMKVALGGGFTGYLRGNAIKYLWRYDRKNGVEDLKKARWYLDRLIQEAGE